MEQFTKKNIETYGYLGTNFEPNPSRGFFQTEVKNIEFTKNNHYRFGYNGKFNNYRDSSSCIYYTDFRFDNFKPDYFHTELIKALSILPQPFAISMTNSLGEYLAETALMFLDVEIIKPNFNDPKFLSFVEKFTSITRCYQMDVVWSAFALELTDLPVVFDCDNLVLVNTYKNLNLKRWMLIEEEQRTSINRYLNAIDRVSYPNIFHYTPELLLSGLAILKGCISDTTEKVDLFDNLLSGEFDVKRDEPVEYLVELSNHYKQKFDKSNELSLIPLDRIFPNGI